MPLSNHSRKVVAKSVLAAGLLAVLAGVAGSQLAPKLPLHMLLFYSLLGAAALLAVLVVATVVVLTLVQFIMRKGGTDPQWFWFSAEPPGLVNLRDQLRASRKKAQT